MFQEPMGNDLTAMISLGIPLEKKTKKQSKKIPSNNGVTLNSLTFFRISPSIFGGSLIKNLLSITHDFIHVQTGHSTPKNPLPKNQVAMAFRTFHAFNGMLVEIVTTSWVASGYGKISDFS